MTALRRTMAALLTLSAVALAAAAPAGAAIPISDTVNNQTAKLTVGPDGTGYFVWTYGSNPVSVHFCRVPPGASTCQNRRALPLTDYAQERHDSQNVYVDGTTVVVTATGDGNAYIPGGGGDATFMWTSTDSGVTFDGGQVVGSQPVGTFGAAPGDEPMRAFNVPVGNQEMWTINTRTLGAYRGVWFQDVRRGSSSSTAVKLFDIDPAQDGTVDAYVGMTALGRPMVVAVEQDGTLHWRVWDGAMTAYTDAAHWTADAPVDAPGGFDPTLLSGPTPTDPLLIYTRDDTFGAEAFRTFNGGGFDASAGTSPRPASSIYPAYALAPDDTLYGIFSPRSHVGQIRSSTDGGNTWGAAATFSCEEGVLPRLAVNSTDQGFAQWIDDNAHIAAARITDRPTCAEPPSTPTTTTTTPTSQTTQTQTPGDHTPPHFTVKLPKRLRLSHGKYVTLKFTCAIGESQCRGTAILRALGRRARAAKTTTLGRTTFTVAGGKTKSVRLTLGSRARKLVRRAGRRGLTAQLTVSVRDAAGNAAKPFKGNAKVLRR